MYKRQTVLYSVCINRCYGTLYSVCINRCYGTLYSVCINRSKHELGRVQLDTVSPSMRVAATAAAVLCPLLDVTYFSIYLSGAFHGLISVPAENLAFLATDVASKAVTPLLLAAAFAAVEPALLQQTAAPSSVRCRSVILKILVLSQSSVVQILLFAQLVPDVPPQ